MVKVVGRRRMRLAQERSGSHKVQVGYTQRLVTQEAVDDDDDGQQTPEMRNRI